MIALAKKYKKHFFISLVLQAASESSSYLTPAPGEEHGDKQLEIKSPLTKLKDSLFLSGKINQSINQFCRNLLKPPLSATFTKRGKKAEQLSA